MLAAHLADAAVAAQPGQHDLQLLLRRPLPIPALLAQPRLLVGRAAHPESRPGQPLRGFAPPRLSGEPEDSTVNADPGAVTLLQLAAGLIAFKKARVARLAPASAGALSRSKPYRPPNCREHSETVHPKRHILAAGNVSRRSRLNLILILAVLVALTSATMPTATTTPTTTTTTTTVPPPSQVWTWDAATAPLDPNSAALMQTFLGYAVVNPNLILNDWGVATAETDSASPCYSVPLTDGGPIDPTVCIPLGTRPDPAGDGHLTVRDTIHGRETDFWQAVYDPTSQRIVRASSAASFPLGFWTECTGACEGGDAADFPPRWGLVTPEEIQAGVIIIRCVSTPQIGAGPPRFPATHNVATTTLSGHLAEGAWLRMDPTVDCSAYGLPSWQVTTASCCNGTGCSSANGETLGIYGENRSTAAAQPSGRTGGTIRGCSLVLVRVRVSRLQVLQPPPQH